MGSMMPVPDDPIIRSMQRTGYPPWYLYDVDGLEDDEVNEDEERAVSSEVRAADL